MSQRRDTGSIDLIKEKLARQIDSLVPQLLPNAVKSGNEWTAGSGGFAPGTSFSIRASGNKIGIWADFKAGKRGDIIDLIAYAQTGGDKGKAIAWARRYLNLDSMDPAERRQAEDRAAASRAKKQADEAKALLERQRMAFGHFMRAVPIKGTPAELYLNGRHIDFGVLGRYPASARFHPAMLCPETNVKRRCLLLSVNDTGSMMVTVHRVFLFQHPAGRWTKADVKSGGPMQKAKRAYSSYGGAWIPVWRGASNRSMSAIDPTEWIAICEGYEDALTIAMVMRHLRVLAAISLTNFATLRLPPCAGIYLCADNDQSETAREQFDSAVAALEARGFLVRVVRPPQQFKDFNEWAAALAEARKMAA